MVIAALLACGGDETTPPPTPDHTGSVGLTCADEEWLPGAYWQTTASVTPPVGAAWMAVDFALDGAGEPWVAVNDGEGASLRSGLDLAERARWDGAVSAVVGIDGAGVPWVGGAADGRPAVARLDGATLVPRALDPRPGRVTAGPVADGDATWFAGTVAGPDGDEQLAVWRVTGSAAAEVWRAAPLDPGDAGAVTAGALGWWPDGRLALGAGVAPAAGGGEAVLYVAEGEGFTALAALPAEDTGGAPGVVTGFGAGPSGARVAWSGAPGWRVYEGAVAAPFAALVDEDPGGVGVVADLAVHPSGAVFAAGGLTSDGEEREAPFVRLGANGGGWTTHLDARAPVPGWIDALQVTADGCVWALCVYGDPETGATDIVLVALDCRV